MRALAEDGRFACHEFSFRPALAFFSGPAALRQERDRRAPEPEYAPALSLGFRRAAGAVMLPLVALALAGDARAEPGDPIPLLQSSGRARESEREKPKAVVGAGRGPLPAQQPALPGVDGVLYLIRSDLAHPQRRQPFRALFCAARFGCALDFQARTTPRPILVAIFTDLRRRNLDLPVRGRGHCAATSPRRPSSMPTSCCGSPDCFRPGRCRSTSISCSGGQWPMVSSTASLSRPRKRRRRPRRPSKARPVRRGRAQKAGTKSRSDGVACQEESRLCRG